MSKINNRTFQLAFLVLLAFFMLSNAAMPGFWTVGGSGSFVNLYQEDSVYLDKVQMQKEKITILLEKGFAVVKGEYWMKNLSSDSIQMHTGYPINASLPNEKVYSVHFSDLYALQIQQDGQKLKSRRLDTDTLSQFQASEVPHMYNRNNWYTWTSDYLPDSLHHLSVYFMVNTNVAKLRKGYSKDRHNGFLYILESGRAWAKNIEQGEIMIQLGQSLQAQDIMGLAPLNTFQFNPDQKRLYWQFEQLEPDSSHNVLIRYAEGDEGFNFDEKLKSAPKYYQKLDSLSTLNFGQGPYEAFQANDFEVHDWKSGFFFSILMFVGVFGFPILLIILGVSTLWFFLKRRRKAKRS